MGHADVAAGPHNILSQRYLHLPFATKAIIKGWADGMAGARYYPTRIGSIEQE